jgi:hypothetical protein
MNYGAGVSLGNATNSLADTSARHTIVCRVSTDMYNMLVDPSNVMTNKADYKTVRSEIALGLGRVYNKDLGMSPAISRKGPAPVITNIAPFSSRRHDDLMSWYIKLYDCRSQEEIQNHIKTSCIVKGQSFFPCEMYFAGFVMSDAQGHPINGDTAVTLFVGGIITIMNGRFPIIAGDQVQWYFEEEADAGLFDDAGDRIMRAEGATTNTEEVTPLDAHTMRVRSHQYAERALTKKIVYVKAYRCGIDGNGSTLMDRRRVFSVAELDAGPYEKVDLKVSCQSM